MAQGVIKDEARRKLKAEQKATAAFLLASEGSPVPVGGADGSLSLAPASYNGFDAPVAPAAGGRTVEERERAKEARMKDFERSHRREETLASEQGLRSSS